MDGVTNAEWYVSYASLNNIQSIYTCINHADNKQPCIGLLFGYQDQSRSIVGQWRWDYRISKVSLIEGKSAVICCRKEQSETLAPEVKIEVSAERTECCDNEWERHPLQGRIVWWFSFSGNYLVVFQ